MDPTDPTFFNDRVFQGFWRRHGPEGSSELLLTLSFYKALIILAILVLAVEYGGSRAWVILRYTISKVVWKPVQLENRLPDRLLRISRGRALMNTFVPIQWLAHWFRRLRSHSGVSVEHEHTYDPGQSAWYGIGSLANVITFVFLGISLPLLLSEGTLSPPIVRSRPLPECRIHDSSLVKAISFIQYSAIVQKTDSISALCQDSFESCFENYGFVLPRIKKRRLDYCPFPGPICDESTKAFEITHLNITAYELGSNSPSKLTFSHRTTCAPVDVDEFTLWTSDASRAMISARATLGEKPSNRTSVHNFYIWLTTTNGPNFVSRERSGLLAAQQNVPPAVHVLPTVDGTFFTDEEHEGWDHVHEYIRRQDGHSFLIVNIAGEVAYARPLDDLFFSAHTTVEGLVLSTNETLYRPDREATTMACVDQYEFCIPGNGKEPHCSGWSNGESILKNILALLGVKFNIPDQDAKQLEQGMASILKTPEGQSIVMDAETIVPSAVIALSLHQSMAVRNLMIPASGLLRDQFKRLRIEYTDEQWILEVETWFTKAIFDSLFWIKGGARIASGNGIHPYLLKTLGSSIEAEWSMCGRVLFRNAGYTNIHVLGFCSVFGVIICISIMSYDIERIYNTAASVRNTISNPRDLFTRSKPRFGSFMVIPRLFALSASRSLQPSAWVSLILTQLNSRTPRPRDPRSAQTQGINSNDQGTTMGPSADIEVGMENIHMDDIDIANLQRGEEIDDPIRHR